MGDRREQADGGGARMTDGPTPDGLPPLREVIATHDLAARKALGQNFLLDLNLTRRIAREAGPLDTVLEIGPGPGGLTRALLIEGAERVVAVERDSRCLPALQRIAERWPGKLDVYEGDARAFDAERALGGGGRIAANLPYNVGTALLVDWLRAGGGVAPLWWRSITVMLQREVAERAAARVGDGAYGRLAILTHWRADARIAFDVPPRAFTPPPKVMSSVLRVDPLASPRFDCPLKNLEIVTAAAFQGRRKMLRSALKPLGDPHAMLAAAGVEPTLRAENLPPEGFAALARAHAARAA